MTNSTRAATLIASIGVSKQKGYSNSSPSHTLDGNSFSQKDQAFVTQLVYGTVQYQLPLGYQLKDLLGTRSKEGHLRPLLLMSVYQLIFSNRVPDRAVLDGANRLAESFGKKNSSGYRLVSGVLRSFLRREQVLPSPRDPVHLLSIEEGVPEWLVRYFIKNWGLKRAEKILLSLNKRAENSIGIAESAGQTQTINSLKKQGYSPTGSTLTGNYFLVSRDIANTDEFKAGQTTIQDEAVGLIVDYFNLQEDDYVLDTCAAPGGKISRLIENLLQGKVINPDIHKKKFSLVKRYAERMYADGRAETLASDARKAAEYFSNTKFSKILVDAPRSGSKLLRRRPEVRYDRTMKGTRSSARIQLGILNSTARLLKENNELVCSTCSVTIEESGQVIAESLRKHPEFEAIPMTLSKV